MPVDALRKSLPYGRPVGQPKTATSISPAQLRMSARMEVVCDSRLSPGARLLYVLLDDYAGMKGDCWPKVCTLAERLGCTARNTKRWLAELVSASHVHAHKTRTVNRYRMAWAGTEMSPQGRQGREESVPLAVTELSPPYMEDSEPEPEPGPCMRCHGTHRITYRGQVRRCGCTVG